MSCFAEDRIAKAVPGNRNQDGNSSDSAAVLEDHGEPSSVRRVHDAALGRAAVQAVQVAVIYLAAGPDAVQVVRDETGLGAEPFPLA